AFRSAGRSRFIRRNAREARRTTRARPWTIERRVTRFPGSRIRDPGFLLRSLLRLPAIEGLLADIPDVVRQRERAICMLDESQHASVTAVFERPGQDPNLLAYFVGLDGDPFRNELRDGRGLERPIGLRSVRVRDGNRQPRVRVDQRPLFDDALESHLRLG